MKLHHSREVYLFIFLMYASGKFIKTADRVVIVYLIII